MLISPSNLLPVICEETFQLVVGSKAAGAEMKPSRLREDEFSV